MQRDQIETYAREIAEQLGESEEGPLRQIELLLEHAGEEFVKSMMEETLKVESGEGLKTEDGKRRRTKGGVFFYITKGKLSTEIRQIIYPNLGQGNKPKQIEWAERLEHLNELAQQEAGKAHSVAITIQGLPMSVKKVDNSVILALSSQPNNQNLAKGIPIPPAQDSPFMVYMGLRQWEAVEESLAKNKNDRLIVEGECCLDSESGTIAVLARTVTTRMTVKSKTREAQPAKPAAQPQEKSKPAGKPAKNNQQAKPQPAPVAQPQPVVAVVEDPIPTTTREKLEQLYSAAETLRDRIQSMESKGQPGVAMTRKLLQSTELQIEALKKQSNK
jgi:hypothetical protein